MICVTVVKILGDVKADNTVSEIFQTLIVRPAYATVGKRLDKQLGIGKGVPPVLAANPDH